MAETNASAGGGMGLLGWLFLLLLFLKLNPGGNFTTPVADWSWWWVTAPLWGGFVLLAVILAVVGIIYGIATLLDKRNERKRRKRLAERRRNLP